MLLLLKYQNLKVALMHVNPLLSGFIELDILILSVWKIYIILPKLSDFHMKY